jgi:PKD repeat protein
MSKRIFLTVALLVLALTTLTTKLVTAKLAPQEQRTDQAFSMLFMSDSQFNWWRGGADPLCFTDDCGAQAGQATNQNVINAMLRVQNLGSWPSDMTFGANTPIIKPQGLVINGDLTAYWHKNEAELYQSFYPAGQLPTNGITLYPGLGNHDYSNNVHGPIDVIQIEKDIADGKDVTGSIYDPVFFPDYNRSAKEAVWYMAGLEEHLPNLVNKDVTGYVKVEDAGAFEVRYTLEYNMFGQHTLVASDEFNAGDSKSMVIPSQAEGIHIKIEENTGVLDSSFHPVWKVAGIFDSNRPRAFYYKVAGTTLDPQVTELPAPSQRPTGSTGSLAYSFDIGKYHFVQLQFRPDYEVDLPTCPTVYGIESPGFKVTKSYGWLHDDVSQAAAAGKYVVINMHDFEMDTDFNSDFANAILGGNVVAIFAGHIHQDFGRIGGLVLDGQEIPFFRSGSAECQKFLLAEFHERSFNIAVVDAADGQPSFARPGVVCDAHVPGYRTNGGDVTTRTFVINKAPHNLSGRLNTAPSLEGAPLAFSATADDPDGDELTYSWDFGDHSTAVGPNPTHVYADDGRYRVTVTVDDGFTGRASYKFDVTVDNADPRVRITSDTHSGFEGTAFSVGSDVTDAGIKDTEKGFKYIWSVTKNSVAFATGTGPNLTFTPDDQGSYSVKVTATDKDGGSGSDSTTFDIKNANPIASVTDAPATSPEGTSITIHGSVTDPGSLDTAQGFTRSWTVTKNGNAFASGSNSSLSFTPDDNGTYVVRLMATDKDGGVGKDSKTINVTNVGPVSSLNNVGPINEGDNANISFGVVTDASSADSAAGFHYSFATSTSGLASSYATAGAANSASLNLPDNGSYLIYGRVFDKDGGSSDYQTSVMVNNLAPVVADIDLSVVGGAVAVNMPLTATASFTDAGRLDTHTARWDWNVDSSPSETSNGTVSESAGSGSVSNSHTYTTAGVFPVKLTVIDKDGAESSSSIEYVVVYDPHEGFVIGGGWLNSPAGSLVSHPTLSGRVNFGFISRYQRRTDVPRGETHLHFRLGNFRFESRQYEWLVVQGALAQYKGTGKVNGRAGYSFLLSAADGQAAGGDRVDRMRLRVWNTATEAVVYDNMRGVPTTLALNHVQAINHGCIVVH